MPATTTYVFADNVNTTLAAAITTLGQTSISISSTANLPTIPAGSYFALTLNDAATQSIFEILYVTAISGSTLTVLRGQEGTAARTWLVGDYAYGAETSGIMSNWVQLSANATSFLGASAQVGSIAMNGAIAALPGQIYSSGMTSLSIPVAVANGDIIAQRSASSGALFLGGLSSDLAFDYGISSAGNGSMNKQLNIVNNGLQVSPTINSTNTLAFVVPAYAANGTALAGTVHMVVGSITGTGSAQSITLTGAAAFANNAWFGWGTVSVSGAAATVVLTGANSFTITGTNGQQLVYFLVGT